MLPRPTLFLPVDVHTSVVEASLVPLDAAPARIVGVLEQFIDTDGSVREDEHESAVSCRFQSRVSDSLPVEGGSILCERRERLDGVGPDRRHSG